MDKEIVDMIEAEAKRLYPDTYEFNMVWYDNPNAIHFRACYIAGRSKSIEEDKKKDERIAELEKGLSDLLLTKSWLPDNAIYLKAKQLLK